MNNLRVLTGSALLAVAVAAAGGVASASVPSGIAPAGTVTAAPCSTTTPAGLGFIGGTVYARKAGGCTDRPSTVTALLLRDGLVAARATCRAEAGRTCFAATPRVFIQPGVSYEAR